MWNVINRNYFFRIIPVLFWPKTITVDAVPPLLLFIFLTESILHVEKMNKKMLLGISLACLFNINLAFMRFKS